ncbi:hypothetical protein JTB14_021349 [Gonioctena quinquepunctata]|nr:hypothetical protein JTB14_021349 [Gonioctena quinquepunctata]
MEEFTYVFSDNSPTIEVEVLNEIDENLSVNQSEVLDTNQLLNKTEKSENASDHNWERYTLSKLKENISSKLKRKLATNKCMEQVTATPSFRKNNDRKRPATIVRALTSSTVAEKYDLLLEKRLKIATLQQQLLEKELNQKDQEIKQKNEEHLKRMHLLDLEIKIKMK